MTHAAILPDPRDPPIRDDGLCVNCEGVRKLPERKLHRDVAASDPFCSAECARAWYGVSLPSAAYSLGRGEKISRTCASCGCVWDDVTDGCRGCVERRRGRERYGLRGAQGG